MAEAVAVKELKGNGRSKETPLIARNDIKLAEAIRNTWFAILSPEQFADRLNGALWTAKSQELRRYDQIFV